jgi:outer membrane lipoprotein SlyB
MQQNENEFTMKQLVISAMITSTLMLGACATRTDTRPVYVEDAERGQFGFVEDIIYARDLASGVGGVAGHQLGSGRGTTVSTVAGAAGGAMIGNEAEKNRNVGDRIEVRVRLDNGDRVTYTQENPRDLRNGDRVRIEGGRVFRV